MCKVDMINNKLINRSIPCVTKQSV